MEIPTFKIVPEQTINLSSLQKRQFYVFIFNWTLKKTRQINGWKTIKNRKVFRIIVSEPFPDALEAVELAFNQNLAWTKSG
jgi:hypothetical protein